MSSNKFFGYRRFQAGNLEFLYGNGQVRRVMVGTTQVVNAIYAAVRDRNWGTVPFVIRQESVRETGNGITIDLTLAFSQDGPGTREKIAFVAGISIRVVRNQLVFSFDGTALTSFEKNRTGICVLHPVDPCSGKELEVKHPDGTSSRGRFPVTVSPHQPFFNVRGMQWKPSPEVNARLLFEGDIFEMEDQRNWSDASYKTYSTPLEIPFPVPIEKGTRIRQKVTLITDPDASLKLPAKDKQLTLYLRSAARKHPPPGPETTDSSGPVPRSFAGPAEGAMPIPPIGISRPNGSRMMDSPSTDRLHLDHASLLRKTGFSHYRADLHLAGIDSGGKSPRYMKGIGTEDDRRHDAEQIPAELLALIRNEQKILGWPVELVLHFGPAWRYEAGGFLEHYRKDPFPLHSLVLLDEAHLSPGKLLRVVAPFFRKELPGVLLGGGTDAYFAELNRNRPESGLLDFIVYSVCPQVHAFDDLTLAENLHSHADMIESARGFSGLPVSVSPVTLSQRINPGSAADSRHMPADKRMTGLFGACWTLGCLKQLIHAGTRSVTLFETGIRHGILGGDQDNPEPFPVCHLLREVLSGKYSHALNTITSEPVVFDAIHLTGKGEQVILLANYTDSEQEIYISFAGDDLTSGISASVPGISGISELTGSGWKNRLSEPAPDKILLPAHGVLKLAITNNQ